MAFYTKVIDRHDKHEILDRTSLFNYFNNIVPISIEYILFGCNVISEELNTLLFKSVQKFIRQTCRFNNYYPQP